ncbi:MULTISPECIES: ATP-binding protein [unclassified Sphingomonas]|uniref:ATP-binding protein n=1 Tax=unclassified Sphingomonas TaxID=196159 RepID=UPI0006F47656|nr:MULTISPECIES: ATP-binding protein [unclassified Sphingomonas]KQX18031.1 histidine kinase [Sphingomonas sp. Root1294]KQY70956.1 histidine kinase [Sphingomonas sp. Root50]KRB91546.1 histidine kinase [Sphingomonas sp. Root720]
MRPAGVDGDCNASGPLAERWSLLASAIERLSNARTLDDVTGILRDSARRIAGADGIAIVLRDGNLCHYVTEDAMAPLWAGQRFPIETCISGIAMRDRQPIVIGDVMADPRVPHAAYAPTFVRSMVMVPIGTPDPMAAMGAYWSDTGEPGEAVVTLLHTLGRAATTALENGRLFAALAELNRVLDARIADRTAELEQAQAMIRQSQKMETIGQLTGNVAHDFNNLLMPIFGSLDLILSGSPLDDRMLRTVRVAMDAADRARLLVDRLLAFARRQPLAPSPVDIRALIEGMHDLLVTSLGARVALTIDVEADMPAVRGDRHQLEMALLNLAVNARDAMPDGGTLALSARRAPVEGRPFELADGHYLRISVTDNGQGMDEATRSKAVEPFFSTKGVGHGTGLGLSMAHGLAAQLGGALAIESMAGLGTTIAIWLPIALDEPARMMPVREAPPASDEGGGLVLVIDDEPRVRSATAEMLRSLGYDAIQAPSAQEGLALLDRGLDPVIVITDHIMPGMTGVELALHLRATRPDLAVLIMSGYQGIELLAPDIPRLTKPFRHDYLSDGIAAARTLVA